MQFHSGEIGEFTSGECVTFAMAFAFLPSRRLSSKV